MMMFLRPVWNIQRSFSSSNMKLPQYWISRATKEMKGKTPMATMTAEGIPIHPLYTKGEDDIDTPGAYPYTRGPYATMYTSKPWTVRQVRRKEYTECSK